MRRRWRNIWSRRMGGAQRYPSASVECRTDDGFRCALPILRDRRARPEIARVRLLLFIAGTVGFLDERKAPRFVKASRAHISLKRPELQALGSTFRDIE